MRIKTETRRKAIIEAATHVFLENGFEKTTMSDIATQLGGSKATLYGYFSTKEDLFLEAMSALGEAHFAVVFAELSNTKGDIRDVLRHFGTSMLRITTSDDALSMFRLMTAASSSPEVGSNMYAQGIQKGEMAIEALLKAAMDAGQLRRCDPQVAADHLRALLEAEFHARRIFSVIEVPSQQKIAAAVDRALDVYLAAYKK
jgi:AcrR family transcriptional regulator